MAFYFFLGFIPILVFAGWIVGKLVHDQGVDTLARPLYGLMPPASVELIIGELRAMDVSTTSIAPLSVIGFVVLMSNGIHNLMDVFELVLHAPHRTWLRQRLLALGWVAVSLIFVSLAAWSIIFVDNLVHRDIVEHTSGFPAFWMRLRRVATGPWERLGVLTAFFGFASIALAAFYRISVAHPRAVVRRVWPGTLVAMIVWVLVSWAFAEYVRTIGHYALYFGALSTVAEFLFWLYLTSLAFLVGAEVNAQLEGVRG